ncbi:MAG TPA: toxin-antitoxin system HicB family antitoxin [Caulobacteraceae bacterium]|nr:toxin-antitoxin system HicB family antitoxin [Caulobacteraceae bacterium]
MDITPHVEALRQDLTRAAEVGGIEVEVAAERLLAALDPAVRLALMDVLSQAAAEISEQLPGVAIDVRLKGREPEFVVAGAPPQEPAHETTAPADEPLDTDADDGVTRITLRLPEALKTRAEALAASRGQSLNTWLVAAAKAAAGQDGPRHHNSHRSGGYGLGGKRITGWAK